MANQLDCDRRWTGHFFTATRPTSGSSSTPISNMQCDAPVVTSVPSGVHVQLSCHGSSDGQTLSSSAQSEVGVSGPKMACRYMGYCVGFSRKRILECRS